MALKINYTDETGTQHTDAYARIYSVRIKYTDLGATIHIEIYHNEAARSKSDTNLTKKSVKTVEYLLDGSLYDTYIKDSVIKADGVSLLSSAYTWLKQHKDGTATHNSEGVRQINEGNGINWTTATDV